MALSAFDDAKDHAEGKAVRVEIHSEDDARVMVEIAQAKMAN